MANRGRPSSDSRPAVGIMSEPAERRKSNRKRKRLDQHPLPPKSIFVAPLNPPVKAYPPIRAGRAPATLDDQSVYSKDRTPRGVQGHDDEQLGDGEAVVDGHGPSGSLGRELRQRKGGERLQALPDRTRFLRDARQDQQDEVDELNNEDEDEDEHDDGDSSLADPPHKERDLRKRALKAWETKRKRRRIADNTLAGVTPRSSRSPSASGSVSVSAASSLPPQQQADGTYNNLPSDDLLQSIQAYSSQYYTAAELILPHEHERSKHHQGQRGRPRADMNHNKRVTDIEGDEVDEIDGVDGQVEGEDESEDENNVYRRDQDPAPKRPSGGQRGRRKKRDMYLALEGSALIALGVLLQEHIKSYIAQAGYVPSSSLAISDDGSDELGSVADLAVQGGSGSGAGAGPGSSEDSSVRDGDDAGLEELSESEGSSEVGEDDVDGVRRAGRVSMARSYAVSEDEDDEDED